MKIKLLNIILVMLMMSACASKSTENEQAIGPNLNSKVPEISAIGIDGQSKSIQSLSGSKGLILVLYRSADWCPYCKKHLVDINQWSDKLKSLGYGIAGISYDNTKVLREFTERKNINYPLISDQNYQTFKAFGVLNQKYTPEDEGYYGIPHSGIMVIDNNGLLTYKYFSTNYANRLDGEKLYNQLK